MDIRPDENDSLLQILRPPLLSNKVVAYKRLEFMFDWENSCLEQGSSERLDWLMAKHWICFSIKCTRLQIKLNNKLYTGHNTLGMSAGSSRWQPITGNPGYRAHMYSCDPVAKLASTTASASWWCTWEQESRTQVPALLLKGERSGFEKMKIVT